MPAPERPAIRIIKEVIDETPTVRTITFEDAKLSAALPGQFAMVWVPRRGELPMSIMVRKESNMAAFTVRRHGPASSGLFEMCKGNLIGVRGPYGNAFDVRNGKILLAGGGTGLVPLMRLASRLGPKSDVTVLIGARTRGEVFFEDTAGQILGGIRHRIIVTTDDGTYGTGGSVADEAQRLCGSGFDAIYTCGPEPMMQKIVRAAMANNTFVQASLERVMKCGVGICGSCCTGGDLVCCDGSVFDGAHLEGNAEFGRTFRNKAGICERYEQGLK